jgi:hypothetical protein
VLPGIKPFLFSYCLS